MLDDLGTTSVVLSDSSEVTSRVMVTTTLGTSVDITFEPDSITLEEGSQEAVTTEVTATASSDSSVSCSFTVSVQPVLPPTLTCPADLNIFVNIADLAAAENNVGAAILTIANERIANSNGSISAGASLQLQNGQTLPNGNADTSATSLTYEAVNDLGVSDDSCNFMVTVDVTAPIISDCPNEATATLDVDGTPNQMSVISWTEPTATDNNAAVAYTDRSHSPGTSFPVGSTDVTYTFTDTAGNTATCEFMVTVLPIQSGPITLLCPDDLTVNSEDGPLVGHAGITSAVVNGDKDMVTVVWETPTFTDSDGVDMNTFMATATGGLSIPTSGTARVTFDILTTNTITYNVADTGGNSGDPCTFTITFNDNTLPFLGACEDSYEINELVAGNSLTFLNSLLTDQEERDILSFDNDPAYNPMFTRVAEASPELPLDDMSPNVDGLYTITFTPPTDASGNLGRVCTFTSLLDTERPVLTGCPDPMSFTPASPITATTRFSWAPHLPNLIATDVSTILIYTVTATPVMGGGSYSRPQDLNGMNFNNSSLDGRVPALLLGFFTVAKDFRVTITVRDEARLTESCPAFTVTVTEP